MDKDFEDTVDRHGSKLLMKITSLACLLSEDDPATLTETELKENYTSKAMTSFMFIRVSMALNTATGPPMLG